MAKKSGPPATPFGRRLSEAIGQTAYKKTDLDKAVGTKNKISGYISGTAGDPRGETIAALCDKLSMSPLWLYEAPDIAVRDYLERVVRRELGDDEAEALAMVRRIKGIPAAAIKAPTKREPFAVDEANTTGPSAKTEEVANAPKPRPARRRTK